MEPYSAPLPEPRPRPPVANPDAPQVLGIDELETYGYPDDWERPEGDVTLMGSVKDALAEQRDYIPGWREGEPILVSRSSLEKLTRGNAPFTMVFSNKTYKGHPVMHICRFDDRPPRVPGDPVVPLSREVYQPQS